MTKQEIIKVLESYSDRDRVSIVINGMVREVLQVSPFGQNTLWIEAESD